MQLISEGQSLATGHSPNSLGMYVGADNDNNAILFNMRKPIFLN